MAGFYMECNNGLKWVNGYGSSNLVAVLLSEAGLKPRSWPESSYELGSNLLSFRTSGNFFWNWCVSFF